VGIIENRKTERFDLKLSTNLSWVGTDKEHKSVEVMTSNICSGGTFFKTEIPFTVGTGVELTIVLPLDNYKNVKGRITYINVSGLVIRTDQRGMAVCFDREYKISTITDI
jgi:hypothetical protein